MITFSLQNGTYFYPTKFGDLKSIEYIQKGF